MKTTPNQLDSKPLPDDRIRAAEAINDFASLIHARHVCNYNEADAAMRRLDRAGITVRFAGEAVRDA